MMACFRMFCFRPTWEEALCMFEPKNRLEAMLACLCSKRSAGMFSHVSLWPNVGRGLVHVWAKRSRSNAGMFWHVSLWPNVGRGLVHVGAERSRSDAGMFWHISLWPNVGRGLVYLWAKRPRSDVACFALAQRGKRPCACLSKTV